MISMRSLKERRVYYAKGLVYGSWYKLYAEGEKDVIMLFQFSNYCGNDVYDIKSYHYEYGWYYGEYNTSKCFRFLDRLK
jgi:hypothetical protein